MNCVKIHELIMILLKKPHWSSLEDVRKSTHNSEHYLKQREQN